jgi:Cys-rich repeat protein
MWMSWAILGLIGCGGDTAVECIDNGQCGEFQACFVDVCLDVECLTSAVCDIGEYCNLDGYSCVEGCLDNSDCRAGETCNAETTTCEAYGCRNTELDCGVGQECDQTTGECLDVQACGNCDPQNINSCNTGPNSGTQSYCLVYDDLSVGWCFPECGDDGSCPSGFYCYEDLSIGRGQTIDVCVADCPWLTENGYM